MSIAEKFYQFLVENLMLFAEKCDDFCKKMLTIFVGKFGFFYEKLIIFAGTFYDFRRKI